MALEITNQIPVVNYGDSTIDTSEKSLIKINATSYNVYDNWFDFIRKYFGIDNLNDPYITTLKASFFGYFNELASSEIKNAVYHRNFLYDEHFLNTAILPESIYNFAKLYNVQIENATPASLFVSISVLEEDLVNSSLLKETSTDSITNANANTLKVYNVTLDRSIIFVVQSYKFILPYPLVLTIQEMIDENGNTTYAYSGNYDTTANTFPILENEGVQPYLKIWRETIDGAKYIFIGCQIYQLVMNSTEINITTTSDNPSTYYHNISFADQMAYFEAFYEYNGKITPINLYFNNIYTPTDEEYYGYYTYLNDSTIQISFSYNLDGFRPSVGSTLIVNTYTTLGYGGNFDYSGRVTMNMSANNSYNNINFNCNTITTGSADGKDKLDTIGQKTKILEAITTRNNIITENDLLKFFDSINETLNVNGSTIKFLKKQDDVIKRIYCNFLLLRDENKRVIPTNTAPHLKISSSDLEETNKNGKYVIREHSIVQCNYVRDILNYNPLKLSDEMKVDNFNSYFDKDNSIRYSQDYIKYFLNNKYFQDKLDEETENFQTAFSNIESIYTKMNSKVAEVGSDELIYTIPFMISLEKEPFLKATYYNVDANSENAMSYEYLNNKVGASFSISTLKIEKDINPSPSNKFTLDSNVYKLSFNLNTNLSYDELKENVVIKCIICDEDSSLNNYGHFFFKLKNVNNNSSSVSSYSYEYEAELATDYSFDNGKLNLYNSLYKVLSTQGRSILYQSAPIGEKLVFKIGILYYNKYLAEMQTINEKKDWRYKFPLGFIQNIEKPTDIIADSFKLNSNFDYYDLNIKGYINIDSILMIPQNAKLDDNATQLYDFSNDYYSNENINKYTLRKNHISMISSFYNENNLEDGKIVFKIKDDFTSDETNYLKLEGYIKLLIPSIELSGVEGNENPEEYAVEIDYKVKYDESLSDFGNKNENIIIQKEFDREGNKFIIITLNSIANIKKDLNESFAVIIHKNYTGSDNSTEYYTKCIGDQNDNLIEMNSNLGYTILQYLYSVNELALVFYNVSRIDKNGKESQNVDNIIKNLSIESITLNRTDDDIEEGLDSKDNIDNYVLASIISNPTPISLYQNMSSLMNSIVTYDEEKDEYDLELVPLISLRYYMARPKTIYDLLNKFINIVDETLPRLENNTNCDLKFYNTYGPSRYFYFSKETISKTTYTNSETNEEIKETDDDFNPYINTVISQNNYTKYNYLGRTDIILDFTIYLYENITNEKDEEIKKYISDYIEETNTELILPISNLITKLQNTFPIIKFIKYNGIFSDIVDSNNSSIGNDYQLIDNDFDFNSMTKDEIRVYVPEYLNLKKDIVKTNESYLNEVDDIFELLKYSTYDYVININYRV